jgi:hypothetical protein
MCYLELFIKGAMIPPNRYPGAFIRSSAIPRAPTAIQLKGKRKVSSILFFIGK